MLFSLCSSLGAVKRGRELRSGKKQWQKIRLIQSRGEKQIQSEKKRGKKQMKKVSVVYIHKTHRLLDIYTQTQ